MTHVQNIDAWGIDPEVARTELQVPARPPPPFSLCCFLREARLAFYAILFIYYLIYVRLLPATCRDGVSQRVCASACTVQPLPGDHGKELQIQGTFDAQVPSSIQKQSIKFLMVFIAQAIAYLTKTFGIEARYIDKK
jgi:hypothetical protein